MELLDQLSDLPTADTHRAAAVLDTILRRARETGIPTALTEHGTPVGVVLSWDLFERLESAAAGFEHARHRLEGCRFGPVPPPEGVDCGCRTAAEVDTEDGQESL
ncbi:type II toxin-antitoxin system prevent-host-death family antitoxin [Streptomyces yaizuensis]|uniref:Type II toxin-antitoxin system Phd/YefM family antitoxin n=1 Tax=Streptomyces yaizuensis TaxID=2989713 RepID=A0ABQ5P3G3_9ACTN|nr:type II toxin-antitoxin system prevent-host-death family antitoxin [Streptomyces sp. YSPA8]GLF97138.1 type II toxin-antitoxin system Phd/YefM family antitoxin [Streptomyces sp. YSPA8]